MKDINKTPSLLKQAMSVNRRPFPWVKAFFAGVAASLPVLIGLLFGNLEYGLIAGMGGFTFLYFFNIPHAQNAKKLFFVVIGTTLASALGTLAAPYPLAAAILMGAIGATAVFIFGALRIAGPSTIFFVLVFALTTGMPVNPELAPVRAGLVFLGAAFSYILAMSSWFFNPHGPETNVVKRVYGELAAFVDAVGTDKFHEAKSRVMSVLKEAEGTLAAAYIPWRKTDVFNRLYVCNDHANKIFLYLLENFTEDHSKLPPELGKAIRELANSLDQKDKQIRKEIPQPDEMDEKVADLFMKIKDAYAIMNEQTTSITKEIHFSKPSIRMIFAEAFDKNSIVFISAVRFGVITTIAAIIAYEFNLERSYWVPLSCVAVLSGATIVATFHRAIQRGLGTIVGILIASILLSIQPSGYIIALFILVLTFITELFIVKNYGLAALFFTPSALLMAESTSHGSFSFSSVASARIIDVLIGSAIGLLGVWLVGRRSASSRLPRLITKTIRSQGQFLLLLFSEHGARGNVEESKESKKMQINMTNLQTLYTTAAGEIPVNQKAVNEYWPVLFSIERLGYLLRNCAKVEKRPVLSEEQLAQLLYVCETMAIAAGRQQSPSIKNVPDIESFPSIQNELIRLQNSLQMNTR
ncbi:FUSC family protein [Sporosarcina sp. ACRSL]|uniref:FUSC family protein n=1 Tax=Sporosarcina sp. ACRSL TaxID=2918215 RepID=UPI001EF4B531|nr:FUSC family protein [Sporosarcina sp. ACRSL]MCG7344747.1 FUSC family protein [Sporosarcina sp. ACRSL]